MTEESRRARARQARWLVATTAVVLVVLSVIPFLARYLINDALEDAGAINSELADVDLNLFTGVVGLSGLRFGDGESGVALDHLTADLALLSLIGGEVFLSSVEVSGLDLRLQFGGAASTLMIGGLVIDLTPTEEEAAPASWDLGLDEFVMSESRARVAGTPWECEIVIDRIAIARFRTVEPEQVTRFDLALAIAGGRLQIAGDATPIAAEPGIDLTIAVDRFPLSQVVPAVRAAGAPDLDIAGDLDVALAVKGVILPIDLVAEGSVSARGLDLYTRKTRLQGDAVAWSGSVGLKGGVGDTFAPTARAIIDVAKLSVEFDPGEPFLVLDTVQASARYAEQLVIDTASITGFDFLPGPGRDGAMDAVGHFDRLQLDGLVASPVAVHVDTIALVGPVINLSRAVDGSVVSVSDWIAAVTARFENKGGGAPPEPASGSRPDSGSVEPPLPISIGSLSIHGNDWLRVADASVKPGVALVSKVLDVRVSGIEYPAQTSAQVSVSLGLNDSEITLSGTVTPSQEPGAEVSVNIKGFSLPAVSGYLPAYEIERGKLSLDTELKVTSGVLDVQNAIALDGLKLTAGEGDDPLLAAGLSMPVDMALNLLRNRNDLIELSVAVTGSIDDPSFGLAQVMGRAMRGALQKAAFAYAKNALQPLGTIMLVSNLASKAARPRFAPLAFAPGQIELERPDPYLEKIAGLLRSRPGLRLTFCGVGAEADRTAIAAARAASASPDGGEAEQQTPIVTVDDTALQQLAEARTAEVTAYLVNRQVAAERLFPCRARVESAAEEQAQAALAPAGESHTDIAPDSSLATSVNGTGEPESSPRVEFYL